MKRCTKCGIEKPDEVFEMQPSKGRRRAECRECRTIAQREWREKRKQQPPQRKTEAKKCAHCQQVKPISEFSPANPGYFASRCKQCVNNIRHEKRRKQYRNDPNGRFYRRFTNEEGVTVKRCIRCHMEKPISEFYANGPKWIHSKCKDCDKAVKKADYDANPEKYREPSRKWMRKYPERHRARFRQWQLANQEYRMQYYRKYNAEHHEERLAYYRSSHRKEVSRMWRQKFPERLTEMHIRRRARKMSAPRIERIDRKAIIERDQWTCYLCMQICTPKNVTLDHIIPLYHGGAHAADNLRVACRSCNSRKGVKFLHEFLK